MLSGVFLAARREAGGMLAGEMKKCALYGKMLTIPLVYGYNEIVMI